MALSVSLPNSSPPPFVFRFIQTTDSGLRSLVILYETKLVVVILVTLNNWLYICTIVHILIRNVLRCNSP